MKFKVVFSWGGESLDEVIIEGESIEEVRINTQEWFAAKGLDMEKHGRYSEEVA
jgi:predicted RNase H-like HicB family nuclease